MSNNIAANSSRHEQNASKKIVNSIRPMLHLMKRARVPWFSYLCFFLLNLFVTERAVRLAVLSGEFLDPTFAETGIHDPSMVWEYVLSSLLICVVGFLTIPMSKISIDYQKRTQCIAWKSLLRLPLRKLEILKPDTLTSRVTVDAGFFSEILTIVTNFFQTGWALILASVVLYETDAYFATRVIPVIVVSILVTMLASRFIYRIYFTLQQAESSLTACLNSRLSALRTIKSAQTEQLETQRVAAAVNQKFKAERNRVTYDTFYSGYQSLITMLLQIFIIVGGALRIAAGGEFGVAQLITVYLLVQKYPGDVQSFFSCVLNAVRIKGQTQTISELCMLAEASQENFSKVESPDTENSGAEDNLSDLPRFSDADIQLQHLSFSYADTERNKVTSLKTEANSAKDLILKDCNLTLPSGKFIAIIGPSGAGKSTLLKILARLYEPSEGILCVGKTSGTEHNAALWRTSIGSVFQDSALISGTVQDNILYGTDGLTPAQLETIVKLCGLEEVIAKLPHGLLSDTGDLSDKVSAGQRQRIVLARALANNPDLLLLDEATANMDPENSSCITQNLLRERRGKTTVLVTHRLQQARLADMVVVMENGSIVASGTFDELTQTSAFCRAMIEQARTTA